VVPWSTTGSVPLIFGCLLSTLRFLERPDRAKSDALLSGLAGGAVAAFRPLDAAILLITSRLEFPLVCCAPGRKTGE
jgi:hypothetical protein